MIIYKLFNSTKNLDAASYKNLNIYGMASIRNGQDTPFVECDTKEQAEEAKRQGRSIVGITAIPFIVPFTSLGTEIHETHTRVNVSGALTLKINPNDEFRKYILSHDGDELTTEQITVEFARGLKLNLDPYWNHIVNTEDVVQLHKHGKDAADISALPGQLPKWCEVVEIQLAADGTDTASRFTQQVAKALAEQEKDAEKKRNTIINIIREKFDSVKKDFHDKKFVDFVKDKGNEAETLLSVFSKFQLLISILFFIALLGGWGRQMLYFVLGSGSPFERKCKIVFKPENSESYNLQKYLLEKHLTEKFRQNRPSDGQPFGVFHFEKNIPLKEKDAEEICNYIDEYVHAHSDLLSKNEDYNHPRGALRILGFTSPHYRCTVEMNGKLSPDSYHLVIKNDFDSTVKQRVDKMLLGKDKGEAKNGFTEYKRLKLRGGDKEILVNTLLDDESLADKGIRILNGSSPYEIIVEIGNYKMNYQLDVSELEKFNELLDEIKTAFQTSVSKDVYFKQGKTETLPLTNDQVEKLQKTLAVKDRVVFKRENVKDSKTERLDFTMSEKELRERNLERLAKQEKVSWWKNNEPKLFDDIMNIARKMKMTMSDIEIHENADDEEYMKLLEQVNILQGEQQLADGELQKLLNRVKFYQSGMETAILEKAKADLKQLQEQSIIYATMAKQIEVFKGKIYSERKLAKTHKGLTSAMSDNHQLEKDIAGVNVPEDAADIDYEKLMNHLQFLGERQRNSRTNIQKLLTNIEEYKSEMQGEGLNRIVTYQKQLDSYIANNARMVTLLDALTTKTVEARWQAKAHKEIARRRSAAGQYTSEVEQTFREAQTAFRQEIPDAVAAGQTKESYGKQEDVAQRWETKSRKAFKDIENYRNTELNEAFTLENRTATWDVKIYRDRLNAVLEGWSSMCRKALNCKEECQYKKVEATYLKNQMEFWKNIEELKAVEQDIRTLQSELQDIRQKLAGMTLQEAKEYAIEIKKWFFESFLPRQKNIVKRAKILIAYFSRLLPADEWDDILPYNQLLGKQFLNLSEVQRLSAENKAKIQKLIEEQNSRFLKISIGNKKDTLLRLKGKAETLQGLGEGLIIFDENERLYKILKVWNLQ